MLWFLVIIKKNNFRIRIECKWQQSSGSVDEKLPYLFLNAKDCMPEKDIMIIIDGKGWKIRCYSLVKRNCKKL